MTRKFILLYSLLVGAVFTDLSAQSTGSPYSFFGAGLEESNGFGVNQSMGGTGIAFKSGQNLNSINPASYTGIDSLAFIFEMGFYLNHTQYSSNSDDQSKTDGNLHYLAMGFRMRDYWYTSIGLVPYSKVGYEINSTAVMDGSLAEYTKTYIGSGGINNLYIGNSFRVFKGLSLGLNLSYIFGSVENSEGASISSLSYAYGITHTTYIKSPHLDYGLQYTFNHKDWDVTLGAVYAAKNKLSTTRESYLSTSDTTSIQLDNIASNTYYIPEKIGFGLAFTKGDRLKFGVDYEQKNWSAVTFENPLLTTRDSRRYSVGMEIYPSKSITDDGWKKAYYRFGANYNNSYLVIDGTPIDSKGITFGVGIPVRRGFSFMNMSLELGQRGTTSNHLIKENYVKMNVNLTLQEAWFQKLKFQ